MKSILLIGAVFGSALAAGSDNAVYGNDNAVKGRNNLLVSFNSNVVGQDNWTVGNGHYVIGNGIKMFGPDADPIFYSGAVGVPAAGFQSYYSGQSNPFDNLQQQFVGNTRWYGNSNRNW